MAKLKGQARQTTEREEREQSLDAEYFKLQGNPAIEDLLSKLDFMMMAHTQVAIDRLGVGLDGQPAPLRDSAERLSHLDRAAGVEEAKTYLSRRINPPKKQSPN